MDAKQRYGLFIGGFLLFSAVTALLMYVSVPEQAGHADTQKPSASGAAQNSSGEAGQQELTLTAGTAHPCKEFRFRNGQRDSEAEIYSPAYVPLPDAALSDVLTVSGAVSRIHSTQAASSEPSSLHFTGA